MSAVSELIIVAIFWALAVEAIRWCPPINAGWPLLFIAGAIILTTHLVVRVGLG